jgi:hypothetical protein
MGGAGERMSIRKTTVGTGLLAAAVLAGPLVDRRAVAFGAQAAQGGSALAPEYLDKLLAPIALYPDALLAQMLLCSADSSKLVELNGWLKRNASLKGSDLQDAAKDAGFEPSFVALAPFPDVVQLMATNPQWTSQIGGAFAVDRSAVFDSIQRLRAQGKAAGNLKSTPQQTVETKTTQSGEQVIVIEPANPQVVYVPVYDSTVVYTQPAATTTTTIVVQEDDDDAEAAVAGLVGFTAGIAIGAAINNNYYYGPYGWHGGGYMYNSGWDDFYDDREDAREDWYDNRDEARDDLSEHRQDMAGERSDRAETAREERTNRTESRSETQSQRQQQRGEGQAGTQQARSGEAAQQARTAREGGQQARSGEAGQQARSTASGQQARSGGTGTAAATAQQSRSTTGSGQARTSGASSYESRGYSGDRGGRTTSSSSTSGRSGTRSDAFSGYSSGRSTRSESSRGQRSRSGGGGGRRR